MTMMQPSRRVLSGIVSGVAVLLAAGVVAGGFLLFMWSIDETRFARPSEHFDAFAGEIDDLPGVDDVRADRWVDAPGWGLTSSALTLAVDRSGLPGLLGAACASDYPDAVTWSIVTRTPAGSEVTLHGDTPVSDPSRAGDARCPDFGFDAVALVDELDRLAPGLAVQPGAGDNGSFALVEVDPTGASAGITHLLPLVAHAAELATAAGVEVDEVTVSASTLDVVVPLAQGDRYRELLVDLASTYGVRAFFADDGTTMADGRAVVQVVAPENTRRAIEAAVAGSALPFAGYPVRFLGGGSPA